jgi:hypothetical protein
MASPADLRSEKADRVCNPDPGSGVIEIVDVKKTAYPLDKPENRC